MAYNPPNLYPVGVTESCKYFCKASVAVRFKFQLRFETSYPLTPSERGGGKSSPAQMRYKVCRQNRIKDKHRHRRNVTSHHFFRLFSLLSTIFTSFNYFHFFQLFSLLSTIFTSFNYSNFFGFYH